MTRAQSLPPMLGEMDPCQPPLISLGSKGNRRCIPVRAFFMDGGELPLPCVTKLTVNQVKVAAANKLNRFTPDIIVLGFEDAKPLTEDHATISPTQSPKLSVVIKEARRDYAYWYRTLMTHTAAGDANGVRRAVCEMSNNTDYHYPEACLMIASRYGHYHIVSFLLQHSPHPINVDRFDDRGYTSLTLATMKGSCETVKVLLEARASIELGGGEIRYNSLCLAAKEGYTDIVRVLIEANAKLEYRDSAGNTPLIIATRRRHIDIVRLLLEACAQVKNRNDAGEDAPYWAVEKDDYELQYLFSGNSHRR